MKYTGMAIATLTGAGIAVITSEEEKAEETLMVAGLGLVSTGIKWLGVGKEIMK